MSHTIDLPTSPPAEITIGTTLEWEKEFADFPADEWTVTYYFRGAGPGFNAVGETNNGAHAFSVGADVTSDMLVGRYDYQAFATRDSEKHLVDEGISAAKASLEALDAEDTYDARSRNRKILDALQALMEGKATLDQQKYMIATGVPGFSSQREVERIDLTALVAAIQYYARLVAGENRKRKRSAFETVQVHIRPASRRAKR